jgi:hypothetical protein
MKSGCVSSLQRPSRFLWILKNSGSGLWLSKKPQPLFCFKWLVAACNLRLDLGDPFGGKPVKHQDDDQARADEQGRNQGDTGLDAFNELRSGGHVGDVTRGDQHAGDDHASDQDGALDGKLIRDMIKPLAFLPVFHSP